MFPLKISHRAPASLLRCPRALWYIVWKMPSPSELGNKIQPLLILLEEWMNESGKEARNITPVELLQVEENFRRGKTHTLVFPPCSLLLSPKFPGFTLVIRELTEFPSLGDWIVCTEKLYAPAFLVPGTSSEGKCQVR